MPTSYRLVAFAVIAYAASLTFKYHACKQMFTGGGIIQCVIFE